MRIKAKNKTFTQSINEYSLRPCYALRALLVTT